MNDLINLSSEMPHLNLPNSCIQNSSHFDDYSMNSFSSMRGGSVTVTGRKITSQNCLSPSNTRKLNKFPIPIQTLSRIKKQNTQVKKILFKKSQKTSNQTLSPKIKAKVKIEETLDKHKEDLNRVSSFPKYNIRDDSPILAVQNETPALKTVRHKTKKLGKKGIPFEVKTEKSSGKGKHMKIPQNELKISTPRACKNELKRLSKIITSRKYKERLEEEANPETKSNTAKFVCDFSKILQKGQTKLGGNPAEAGMISNKRHSEAVTKYTKEKRKKIAIKRLKKHENIFQDHKKKLSVEMKKIKDEAFKGAKLKICKKTLKKSLKRPPDLLRLEKDSIEPRPKSIIGESTFRDSARNFFPAKTCKTEVKSSETSAILIQSHIRRFLARKKYKKYIESFSIEDAEVKSIISSWKKDSIECKKPPTYPVHPHQLPELDSLQRFKAEEISLIKTAIQQSDGDANIIENITKIINSRYQNIAKLIQTKHDRGQLYRINEDKEISGDLECSEEDYDGIKFTDEKIWGVMNEADAITKDNSVTPSKSDSKSSLSEIVFLEHFIQKPNSQPHYSQQTSNKVFTSNALCEISNQILSAILLEELAKYSTKTPEPIEKPLIEFDLYLSSSIKFLSNQLMRLEPVLKRPLRKSPLEILAKMQMPYTVNPQKWLFSALPSIIPVDTFEAYYKLISASDPLAPRSQVKMFFDSCNEILQTSRPYGLLGAPMPWALSDRKLKPASAALSTLKSLEESIRTLNNIRAGKISDLGLNEDHLQQSREEKIGIMIADDIHSNESYWVDYSYEDTQTKLSVSDKILDSLFEELIKLL